MILTADDLRPGVRFKYNGHPVEILRDLEKRKDRFGLELDSWWSRRIDTGDEGYVSLGPGGVLRVEPLKTPRAQLEREIAKSLATPIQRQAEPSPIQQRAETPIDWRYKHRTLGRKSHAHKKLKGRSSSSVLTTRPERQLLLWIPFATKGSISIARPVPVDFTAKEVESVWTLPSSRNPSIPPVLPLHPVHGRGAFLEDYGHDWTVRGGNFIYRSRITDQPTWVLVQLK